MAADGTSRRELLQAGGLGALGLCLGCGSRLPPATQDSAAPDSAGSSGDSAAPSGPGPCEDEAQAGRGGWQVVPLEALPEPGAGMPVELEGHAVVLARPEEGCAVVVARACTHQGCDVAFSEGRFVCPCHGAAFGLDGRVLSGPTSVPLRRYPAELRDGVLWVDLG